MCASLCFGSVNARGSSGTRPELDYRVLVGKYTRERAGADWFVRTTEGDTQ